MIEILKNFKKLFTPQIAKPIIYKAFYKFLVALVPLLIWDRFINTNKYFSLFETGFFIAGAVFLMLAWMNYLKMDGMSLMSLSVIFGWFKKDENTAQKKHGGFMDYVQQEIPDYDDLSDFDKLLSKFGSNLLLGILMVGISLIAIAV